jgi:MinD-like ATPase involved in chromosome partitioning or flagellar assembly
MLALWSPKGGVGTSVLAAAVALAVAHDGRAVGLPGSDPPHGRLVDLTGDQPAVLGLGADPELGLGDWVAVGPEAPRDALERLGVAITTGLVLLPRGAPLAGAPAAAGVALASALRDGRKPVVADCGTAADPATRACTQEADTTLVVLRPCYLALRRAVHDGLLAATDGVVLVEEPGRALGSREVTEVLDLPVVAQVPLKAEVARAVDAGVLVTRMPAALERPALRLASRAGLLPARRGAAA